MEVTPSAPPSPFGLRTATLNDYPAIVEVWRRSRLHVHTDGRESQAAFEHQLRQFPDLYFVAECDGRVVGVVLGSHDHRKGWINRLGVLPEYQRRGIGAALVKACDSAIRRHGIEIVAALVETHNLASSGVFERLGFKSDIPVRYFRRSTEESQDAGKGA